MAGYIPPFSKYMAFLNKNDKYDSHSPSSSKSKTIGRGDTESFLATMSTVTT